MRGLGQQQENTDSQEARHNKDSEFTSYLREESNIYETVVKYGTEQRGWRPRDSVRHSIHLCTNRTEMDRKDGLQKHQNVSISVLSFILCFLKVCKIQATIKKWD